MTRATDLVALLLGSAIVAWLSGDGGAAVFYLAGGVMMYVTVALRGGTAS